jgi:hypothetical protein
MARAQVMCDQCGNTDNHPMAHFGGPGGRSVHHDCMSVSEEQMARAASPAQGAVIDACKNGLKGTALLEFIEKTNGGQL